MVDLGASWVEGMDGNPMTRLAEQANARLFPTPPDGATQYLVGPNGPDREASEEEVAVLEAGAGQVEEAVPDAAESLAATGEDASLEELADELRAAADNDDIEDDTLQLAGIE